MHTTQSSSTEKAYRNLADYAEQQGASEAAFIAAGWQPKVVNHICPVTKQRRPALQFKTDTGNRWRFVDGQKPKYTSPKGYKKSLYRLAEAVAIAQKTGQPLIICNGEAGTIVAQHQGLAATAITGGESGNISKELLAQLKAAYPVGTILVVLDSDHKGRTAGPKLALALWDAGYEARAIDLQLSDKGDLADFCKLHTSQAMEKLLALPILPIPEPKPILQLQGSSQSPSSDRVDWDTERQRWWLDVVLPAVKRATSRRNGKHFQCINPNHPDEDPSARISTDKDPGGIYICTCGSHSREEVASWVGVLDFMTWWKDNRAHLYPHNKSKSQSQETKQTDKPYEPFFLSTVKADIIDTTCFIGDLLTPEHGITETDDLLMISDMGTGKTMWAAKQGITTSITHRESLSAAQAKDLDTENYKGLTSTELRQVPRLTVCLNSLHKCGNRPIGTLLLDEIQQMLTHLGGDTFKSSEAETAFNTLEAAIRRADRVIAADAYANETTIKWLKELRPNLKVVVNTYNRERGPLFMWTRKGGLTAHIWQLADENRGTVVVPTSSKEWAKDLERVAVDRYGEAEVIAIYQDVANEPRVRAFLKDPDTQIGHYKVVIYSPTVGGGINIQMPVYAICGFFFAEPLPAPECHQMLNRCRNTQQTHVYIERREGSRETNSDVLYQQALDNATATGFVAHFDEHGLPIVTESQRRLHRLLSDIEASDNASKIQLYDHFMTLAHGYKSITYTDKDSKSALIVTAKERERRQEEDKAKTLTAVPLSPEEYHTLVEAGSNRPEHTYGLCRWHVEKCGGRIIDSVTYDLLYKPESRAALYLLTDHLHGRVDDLARSDRDEHRSLPGKRHHYTRRKRLVDDLIKRVFGREGLRSDVQLSAKHIEEVVGDFLAVSGEEFNKLFKRRADLSQSPVAFLRWVLSKLGLKLESHQVRDDYARHRVYSLRQESLIVMIELASTCYARQIADRFKQEGFVSQNPDQCFPHPHDLSRKVSTTSLEQPPISVRWAEQPTFYELLRPNLFTR